jgi:hypothetical protein
MKQQIIYKAQPVISPLLKEFPVEYNGSYLHILGQVSPIHALYYLLIPTTFIHVCTQCMCQRHSHLILLYFTNQYNTVISTID